MAIDVPDDPILARGAHKESRTPGKSYSIPMETGAFQRSWLVPLLAALSAAVGAGHARAQENDDLETQIKVLIGTHNLALPLSLSPDPLVGIPAGIVTFATNPGLKDTRAVFVTPRDWSDWPSSPDGCAFDVELPQSRAEYSNLLGFIDLKTVPSHWGELTRNGSMQVSHANTDVNVHVVSPNVDADEPGQQPVSLPPGNHGFGQAELDTHALKLNIDSNSELFECFSLQRGCPELQPLSRFSSFEYRSDCAIAAKVYDSLTQTCGLIPDVTECI
jgi:hypothetical protein